MAITEHSVVVGVFAEPAAAEQAISALQQAGFDNNQIKFSVQKGTEGILDGLAGMGLTYNEAGFYNREFFAGRTIVVVRTSTRQQEAYNILRSYGAYDSSTRSTHSPAAPAEDQRGGNQQTLQVREEVLQVQKYWVQSEEIRIHRRVITEEKVFKIPVSREEITIERVPLDPDAQPSLPQDGQNRATVPVAPVAPPPEAGETIKIPVREERVSFQKMPFVIEEITLTKRVLQETKHITATVQHEKARLESRGNVHIQGDYQDEASAQE